ncbi:MAG: lipoprotein [Candidatus Omnitrophota bacterium]
MKKILVLVMFVFVLTGCQSAKYAFDQTFGDQTDYGAFQTKTQHPPDNLLASADGWIKKHLW